MARLIVVGGGIGGLAIALSAAASGNDVVVLERAREFAEIGAGIQLAPNGLHALGLLGVGEKIERIGVQVDSLRLFDATVDRLINAMSLGADYQHRFDSPYLVVHRAELHRILVDACASDPRIELRSRSEVFGYQQDAGGVRALLADGSSVDGDGLIGADGINSSIRRALLDDGEPRVAGITVYRTTVPIDQVDESLQSNSVTWWTGPGCHLVTYPIAGGSLLNLAASRTDGVTQAFSGVEVSEARVLRELAPLRGAARSLLELGREWRSWSLVDRDPVRQWSDGRVVLLGDAAHPMLHYAAQGASQALEDAVVLGALIGADPDRLPGRFTRYVEARRDRTADVTLAARDSIGIWHAAGDAAIERNEKLGAMRDSDLHDELAWMHGDTDFGLAAVTSAVGAR
ncbi:FAD-dependent monooxygenase [Mycobacteroides chelonae]|uniref:FAD-dependent monooxygenase n=1 Tax=Mycobacteroides chelonae TaxID=1774 RepID=UPI0008A8BDD3|nr:FAD-dependent monooxygenase [Mycobacteroides chelonae]AYM40442.1 3-hydroxybenzoate 6-monooxygenase [[Mycobacterium] chelonae subsp. gwanakae]OHU16029.1 salicylate hydroxylase [Mycobacteroides chelonae]